jgi:O-antigen/teichoic acid export membrane protein
MSGPLLIVRLTMPIQLQCDRIVLSHYSTSHAVTNYAVCLQLFAPIITLLAAASQPLWPMFTAARSKGEQGPNLGRILTLFLLGSIVVSGILVLLADPIGNIVGGKQVHLGSALPFAAGVTTVIESISLPIAMAVMDPRGVRFTAVCALIATPTNVVLSIWLAKTMGAPGPLYATCIAAGLLQGLPVFWYYQRRNRAEIDAIESGEGLPDYELISYDARHRYSKRRRHAPSLHRRRHRQREEWWL